MGSGNSLPLKRRAMSIIEFDRRRRQMWLDLLAPEVLCQIGGFLIPAHIHKRCSPFFETSLNLRRAMQTALDDYLTTLSGEAEKEAHELQMSRTRVEQIHIDCPLSELVDKDGCSDLTGQKWDEFQIDVVRDKIVLRLIAEKEVKLLCASVLEVDPRQSTLTDFAITLGIRELHISCSCASHNEESCFVQELTAYMQETGKDDTWKVEKLGLECTQSRRDGYVGVVSAFKNLREVTLHRLGQVDVDFANRLRELDKVHLREVEIFDLESLLKLKECVATINVDYIDPNKDDEYHLGGSEIASLSAFARLESFNAYVAGGAEAGLAALPSTVKELVLDWGPDSEAPYSFENHTDYCPIMRPGLIGKFTERCPNLSVVYLHYVVVPGDDVIDILRRMGTKLREFGVPMWHDKNRLETLSAVAEEVALSNLSMRKLELYGSKRDASDESTRCVDIDVCSSADARKLRAAFGIIRRRSPVLDTHSLEEAISYVFGVPWSNLEWT